MNPVLGKFENDESIETTTPRVNNLHGIELYGYFEAFFGKIFEKIRKTSYISPK